jgi:hypothetical protein
MNEKQRDRFGEAVERKKEQARKASEQADNETGHGSAVSGDQEGPLSAGQPQDTRDTRQKSVGHKKKTADKWNQ